MTATYAESPTSPTAKTHSCGCGCSSCAEHPERGCCSLACFERPNYFCGHLLTDEDLSLELRYVVEKNKLRNRSFFGHGIACGLQLACDCHCDGFITVGQGYAIDCCGNDLVVCEQQKVNVIDILRKKKLLVGSPPRDPCDKNIEEPSCHIKQCFYVVACYHESQSDYTTPFQAGCGTGPAACLPTRIHEGVRFDIVQEIPEQASYEAILLKHIRASYSMFSEGALGQYMKSKVSVIRDALDAKESQSEGDTDYCDVFCTMRAYFLHYLKEYPDPTQCLLYEEVRDLSCPRKDPNRQLKEVQSSFTRLITLMQSYQYNRVLHGLAFGCNQPRENCCVVLGTVEVLDGKLRRVCHTPRKYLWSAANLSEVFMYDLLTRKEERGSSYRSDGREDEKKTHCCTEFDVDCRKFLDQFEINENARQYAAEEPVMAVSAIRTALHHAFNFTDSDAVSIRVLDGLDPEKQDIQAIAKKLNLSVATSHDAPPTTKPSPMQTLAQHTLLRSGDSVVAFKSTDLKKIRAVPFVESLLSSRNDSIEVGVVPDRQSEVETLRRQLDESRAQMQAMQKHLDEISGRLSSIAPNVEGNPQ